MTTQWDTVSKYYFESRFYYMKKHHGWFAASLAETADFLSTLAREAANQLKLRKSGPSGLSGRLAGGFLRSPRKP